MIAIFPIIYLLSFIVAVKELIKGNKQGFFLYLIFGLSIYNVTLSSTFLLGFKNAIVFFQSFKEIIIIILLAISAWNLRTKLKLHFVDYCVTAFFLYTLIYALFPIGEQNFATRMLAFKSTSFFTIVYFAGRLFNPESIYISKYFHYILLLSIAAGVVLIFELITNQNLQTFTGYAQYSYYYYNFEPSGNYGLSWTFESEGGFKRFASFFTNPLEYAGATLITLAAIIAVYTRDDYKFSLDLFGKIALIATILAIIFAISRAAFAGYFIMIYVYAFLTRKKSITYAIHSCIIAGIVYFLFLLTRNEDKTDGILQVILNTINFSNPSSVGHVLEWVEGILSMGERPLGLGLGTSGRIAGSMGENIGGENQFIIIGVQAGIIALGIYLTIYIALIKTARHWYYRLKGKEKKVCIAILLMKIGFIIPLFTSELETSNYISYMTWFFSGLFISMIAHQKEMAESIDNEYPLLNWRKIKTDFN